MAKIVSQKAVIGKILKRIRHQWPALTLSLLLATVYVAMSLYIPILVGNAIDCIIDMGLVDFAAMWVYLRNVAICAAVAGLSQWIMNEVNNRMIIEFLVHVLRLCM